MDASARSDPQAWPALADAHRRAGRLDEARKVAEEGLERSPEDLRGRIALALTLLDRGQPEAARSALATVFDSAAEPERQPEHEPIPNDPFASFAAAGDTAPDAAPAFLAGQDEPRPEPDTLAGIDELELEDAFDAAETRADEMHNANHVAEAALHAVESGEPEGVWAPETESPFATRTVADLLEQQGHEAPARELREEIQAGQPHQGTPAYQARQRTLATLERWLGNLRRSAS